MAGERRVLPACAESIPQVRHLAVEWATGCGATDADLQRIALAVTEAATNVVVHAYRDRTDAGNIIVELECEDSSLRISVHDEGVGMAPRADSPGLGLGMPLIAQMADSLEILTDESGGTEVCMRFAVPA